MYIIFKEGFSREFTCGLRGGKHIYCHILKKKVNLFSLKALKFELFYPWVIVCIHFPCSFSHFCVGDNITINNIEQQ